MRKALSEESLGSQFSMQSSDLRADMLRDELRKKIQEEEKLRKELDEARGEVQSLVAARPLLKHVAKLRKTATSAIQALRHKEKDKEKEEASQDELRHEEVDLQAEEDDLFQVRRITAHLNVLQEKIRDLEKERELPLPSDEEDFADFTITDPLRLKDKVKVIDSDTDEEKKVAETRDESKAVEEAANPVDDVLPPTSSKIVELPEFKRSKRNSKASERTCLKCSRNCLLRILSRHPAGRIPLTQVMVQHGTKFSRISKTTSMRILMSTVIDWRRW